MIELPGTSRTWKQVNRSTILGNLMGTFNVDLQSNLGNLQVSNRIKLNTKTGDSNASNLGLATAFKAFDTMIFAIGGSRMFKNTTVSGSSDISKQFVEDTSTGAPTNLDQYSDMETYIGALCVTSPTHLYAKFTNSGDGNGNYIDEYSSLTADTLHLVKYFKKFDRLYVTNGNDNIISFDTSFTAATSGDYFLDVGNFPNHGYISAMAVSSNSIWIGMTRKDLSTNGLTPSNETFIFEWDGISSTVSKPYKIPAVGINAIVIENDIPIAIDTNGILRKFDGTGFSEVGRLPLKKNQLLGTPYTNGTSGRYIHPNGMKATEDGTILALICNTNSYLRDSAPTSNEFLPSGIWEWSKDNGFTHKHALSTVSTTSPNSTDLGQNRLSAVGALHYQRLGNDTSSQTGAILCGAQYYTNATSTNYGIFSESPFPPDAGIYAEGRKMGYLVTTIIHATNIVDVWQKLFVTFKNFVNENDRIVPKYRTTQAKPQLITGTWATTTTFTTTDDVSGKEGYEVEVLQGPNSGWCAHITSISLNAGTYTVTIDETIDNTATTFKARVQNWTKLKQITGGDYGECPIAQNSTDIQLKVVLHFSEDDELQDLILINKPHITQ